MQSQYKIRHGPQYEHIFLADRFSSQPRTYYLRGGQYILSVRTEFRPPGHISPDFPPTSAQNCSEQLSKIGHCLNGSALRVGDSLRQTSKQAEWNTEPFRKIGVLRNKHSVPFRLPQNSRHRPKLSLIGIFKMANNGLDQFRQPNKGKKNCT